MPQNLTNYQKLTLVQVMSWCRPMLAQIYVEDVGQRPLNLLRHDWDVMNLEYPKDFAEESGHLCDCVRALSHYLN